MDEWDRSEAARAYRNPADPRGLSGFHDDRLCGLRDLLHCARGASVLDIAMNHGLVGFQLARHGAALVHGCDYYEPAVNAARAIFSELPIPSRFEVVDLAQGPAALQAAFAQDYLPRYDIVLFLGIYHKLKQQTSDAVIAGLVHHLIDRTGRYFAVRSGPPAVLAELGSIVANNGLHRDHFSALSPVASAVEIWQRR